MDDALVLQFDCTSWMVTLCVLILVLMDDALVLSSDMRSYY